MKYRIMVSQVVVATVTIEASDLKSAKERAQEYLKIEVESVMNGDNENPDIEGSVVRSDILWGADEE